MSNMARTRRLWSGVLVGQLLLGLLCSEAAGFWEDEDGRVTGLPPGFDARAHADPYRGPHPSQLKRPAETFRFPIRVGEVGPDEALFAGPKQYPFICDTEASGLGQPLVDNLAGIGTRVDQEADREKELPEAHGYSKDCLAPTKAWYYYKPRGKDRFSRWNDKVRDAERITVNGVRIPFVVRVEMGTINRFIYVLVALRGAHESLATPTADRWNGRLIYQFYGGVGIGHRQGRANLKRVIADREKQLAQGYAVIASTGTTTANHYNMWLIEDTALRVKRQFAALYGEPEYTVGVGGSGGAIQQYLLAQNHPGLLDAGVAQYAYPDMITQTVPIFDCELLEYYFDVTDGGNAQWARAENRSIIEGLNANNDYSASGGVFKIQATTRLSYLARGEWRPSLEGQTECAVAWRGLTPLVLNPLFTNFENRLSESVFKQGLWSYYEDLKQFFGTDKQGYARVPWDNVGVQYGLRALQAGRIGPEQFLRLNARVGSWKAPSEMQPERFWLVDGGGSDLRDFSPWSAHNMNLAGVAAAPRFEGDRLAMEAAYRSGQVFLGQLDMPVIDVRHYLEPDLDMHHESASFSTRERILAAGGSVGNQSIWVSDSHYDPTPEAFAAIDSWWRAKQAEPERSWAELRPSSASDRCFDREGKVMASGEHVWDGDWNGHLAGACTRVYPMFANSRMVAGESIAGDRFKCALQPVAEAIDSGVYAPVDMHPYRARLEQIFPQGVCDYRQGDVARPADLLQRDVVTR
ncbi:DUF6351 family protein [Azoarcus sp. KH32C]|uniref:DUF6351 family protein n=1 Tax=Azoarcus sp. KH32C TaxID=748247 RepID=UPI0002386029|nr:DUF6351 family protein [Azoarcus sp. KH32C]BAL25075.1 hypothetical protein AZKH_2769 [Azoarcus sp. KH32C]